MTPGQLLGLATSELALTDKRVIGKVGMFWRKTIALPHKQIETITVQRGLIGAMFNYGTISIQSNGGDKIKFKGIAKPNEIEQEINQAVEIAVLGRNLPKDANAVPQIAVKAMPMIELPPAQPQAVPPVDPPSPLPETPPKPTPPSSPATATAPSPVTSPTASSAYTDPNVW